MITNDASILGILVVIIAIIFHTSQSKSTFWQKFYNYIPDLVLCYFLPSLFNTFKIISLENSKLYFVVMQFCLPAALVLFTMSVDFKEVRRLGKSALIMFFASAFSIMLGGPIAVLVIKMIAPAIIEADTWKGLATLAGTWIGGGANQLALKEVFKPSDNLYSAILAVDTLVAYTWMAALLYGASITKKINTWLNADDTMIEQVKQQMETYKQQNQKITSIQDLVNMLAIGFGITGLAHFFADKITVFIQQHLPILKSYGLDTPFFWIMVIAATGGILLSFTKFRKLEGAGSTKLATVFIYLMAVTIGLKMNIMAIFDSSGLILVGIVWMFFHILIMLLVAKLTKSPFFFVAVGSQACVGGPVSAPIVAAAFNPALAPVGVLLAILGYAFGTYLGYICGLMMQWASN